MRISLSMSAPLKTARLPGGYVAWKSGRRPRVLTYRNLVSGQRDATAPSPAYSLYPDPPLGDEETRSCLEDLNPSNLTVATPTANGRYSPILGQQTRSAS
jgi:hypothetical protein